MWVIGKNIHYIARLIYWSSSRSFVFNLSSFSLFFACLRRHANRLLAPSLARTIHLRQVPRVTTIISRDVSYSYVLARIRPRISVFRVCVSAHSSGMRVWVHVNTWCSFLSSVVFSFWLVQNASVQSRAWMRQTRSAFSLEKDNSNPGRRLIGLIKAPRSLARDMHAYF